MNATSCLAVAYEQHVAYTFSVKSKILDFSLLDSSFSLGLHESSINEKRSSALSQYLAVGK